MPHFQSEKEKKEFTHHLFDTLREGLLVLSSDFNVRMANASFYDMFQVNPDEIEGKNLFELGNNQWDVPEFRNLLEDVLPEEKKIRNYEIELTFNNIGHRVMLLNAHKIDDSQLILLAFGDVTERKQAMEEVKETKDNLEEQVEERTEKVRDLASRITEVEQKERNRIADILHDELQQYLVVIQMNLKNIQQQVKYENLNQLSEKASESIRLINQSIDKTKQLSSDLSPPVLESKDLDEMLEWLVKRFSEMHNLNIDLQIKVRFRIHEEELRAIILKIVRELLFNIVKHAGTDQAVIKANETKDNQLAIHVIDEGSGFDMNKPDQQEHFGIVSVNERLKIIGGDLKIDSTPGKGTHMKVIIPEGDSRISEKSS